MKRKLWIMLAAVLLLAILWGGSAMAADREVSGVVNASTLQEGDSLLLTGDTTLYMDADLKLFKIRGDYALNVQGDHWLSVQPIEHSTENAVEVSSFYCSATFSLGASYYGLIAEQDITVSDARISMLAGSYGLYSRNGDILLHCIDNDANGESISSCIYAEKGSVTITGNLELGTGRDDGICIYAGRDISITDNDSVLVRSTYNTPFIQAGGNMTLGGNIDIIYVNSGSVTGEYSVYAGGNLSIRNGSNISLTSKYGIGAAGITMADGTLNVTASDGMGLYAKTGNISLNGNVSVDSLGSALYAKEGSVSVTGKLYARNTKNSDICIAANRGITLNGQEIRVTAATGSPIALNSYGNITLGGDVIIHGGTEGSSDWHYSVYTHDGSISILNGSSVKVYGKYGMGANSVTMAGGTLGVYVSDEKGINAETGNISLNGTVTVSSKDTALYAKAGSISVNGNLTAHNTNENICIAASTGISLTGGNIQVNASSQSPLAIRTYESITLGGNVTIAGGTSGTTNLDSSVLAENGSITIQPGAVVSVTGKHGLWANSVIMRGNSLTVDVTEGEAIHAESGEITIQSPLEILKPSTGAVVGKTIKDISGYIARYVEIARPMVTIHFDNRGGSGTMEDVVIPKGSTYTLPENPFTPPVAHAFVYWSIDGVEYHPRDHVTVTKNIYVYANWKRYWNVSFYANTGSGTMDTMHVFAGDEIILPLSNFTPPDGSVFSAWKIDDVEYAPGDKVVITGTTTIYAMWRKYRTVTFNMCGHGTAPEDQTVLDGDPAKAPPAPTAEGYLFGGWFTNQNFTQGFSFNTPVTKNMTLYARWYCRIHFDVNTDGTPVDPETAQSSAPADQLVRDGTAATLPHYYLYNWADIDGWYVEYWYTEPECEHRFSFSDPVTEGVTLYAKWVYDGHTVTYDWRSHYVTRYSDDGATYTIPSSLTYTIPVRVGQAAPYIIPVVYSGAAYYIFDGWYKDTSYQQVLLSDVPVTENMTVYAKWIKNPQVSFSDRGVLETTKRTVRYGDPLGELPARSETGWEWRGWYYDEACTDRYTPTARVYNDMTLYAGWIHTWYSIEFNVGNGYLPYSMKHLDLHYGDALSAPGTDPTMDGMVFAGWSLAADSTVLVDVESMTCTGPITFYAVFIPEGIPINETNFPDENFRTKVREYDADGNGTLSTREIHNATALNLSGLGITNLTGLEHFTFLSSLDISGIPLTELSTEILDRMKTLDVSGTGIQTLNMGGNTVLTSLHCENCTGLLSLDLKNCQKLVRLFAEGCTSLTSMVIRSEKLKELSIYNTGLTTVDLTACPNMAQAASIGRVYDYSSANPPFVARVYGAAASPIATVWYSPGTTFETAGIPIDQAHFPGLGFREYVAGYCDTNHNGYLSQSERDAVTEIGYLEDVGSLEGITYFPNVSSISASGLMELNVSGLSHLKTLDLHDNQWLTSLTLGNAPLTLLDCRNAAYLCDLDLSGQPDLLKAYLQKNGNRFSTYTYYEYFDKTTYMLYLENYVNILQPEWQWEGVESAAFILPNGTRYPAEITRRVSDDHRYVAYYADVTVGGVPFTDMKYNFLITFSGADIADQEVKPGTCPATPETPIRAGSIFEEWYRDPELTEIWDPTVPVSDGFTVYVGWNTPDPAGFLKLPAALSALESRAFSGVPAQAVIIPRTISEISWDAFFGSSVLYIYGYPGTIAEDFANTCGFIFVPVDDAWTASH